MTGKSLEDLLVFASEEQPSKFYDAFDEIIGQRAIERLEDHKNYIASTLYGEEDDEEEGDYSYDNDDETYDDATDDDDDDDDDDDIMDDELESELEAISGEENENT